MRKIAVCAFICTYLGALLGGNVSHALQYGTGSHPLMYFVVWDMFCGWSAYNQKTHIIAEGASEKFYELAPGPWGAFKPWGAYARHNYDPIFNHAGRIARNTLAHTQHEPIARIYVVEECWAKKFDLPDHVWKLRYGDQPKTFRKYCHVQSELRSDGQVSRVDNTWAGLLHFRMLSDNPRLRSEIVRTRPMFLPSQASKGKELSLPGSEPRSASNTFGMPAN